MRAPRMLVRLALIGTLLAAPISTIAAGSDDDLYLYLGTVAKLDAAMTRLTVAWTDETGSHAADVAIGPATSFTRDGRGVARTALTLGEPVFIVAEINPYLELDVPEATDIMLGRTEWPKYFP